MLTMFQFYFMLLSSNIKTSNIFASTFKCFRVFIKECSSINPSGKIKFDPKKLTSRIIFLHSGIYGFFLNVSVCNVLSWGSFTFYSIIQHTCDKYNFQPARGHIVMLNVYFFQILATVGKGAFAHVSTLIILSSLN